MTAERVSARIAVGCRTLAVTDEVQGARVPTWVLYPASASPEAPERPERFGPYELTVARDAPVVVSAGRTGGGSLPLVVISHGNGGSPWTYRETAAHLARAGFAVALLEHPGNSRSDNSLAFTAANLANRPRHVRLVIDAVLADAALGPRLAPAAGVPAVAVPAVAVPAVAVPAVAVPAVAVPAVAVPAVAVIGHSIGAYTALAVAGGQPTSLPNEEPDGTPRPVPVVRDPRVRAVVLLAPAAIWYRGAGALAGVDVPVWMRTGERDAHAAPIHAQVVARGLPASTRLDHEVVAGAGHFSFQAPFPPAMVSPEFPPSQDPPGFDRAAYQLQLNADITAFLRASLAAE